MLASLIIYTLVQNGYEVDKDDDDITRKGFGKIRRSLVISVVSLTKVYLELYLKRKYGDSTRVNVSLFINRCFEEKDELKMKLIGRITKLSHNRVTSSSEFNDTYEKLLDSNNYYIRTADELREHGVNQGLLDYIESGNEDDDEEVAVTFESQI